MKANIPRFSSFLTILPALCAVSFSPTASAQEENETESTDGTSGGEGEEAASEVSPSEGEASEGATGTSDAEGEASAPESADSSGVESGGGLFESASGGDEEASDSALSLQWGGYVRGDIFVGAVPGPIKAGETEPGPKEPGINAAYGEVSLQPLVKAGSWGSAFADLRVRYGQQLENNGLIVDLREAYASAYMGPVELRMGKQIVVWGKADGFNPTNNISAADFRIRSPIEDDRRIGNVGARGFLTFNPVKLEVVWMPLYEPTMYPEFTPTDGVTRFTDPSYPSVSLRNSLIAGRFHLELSSFDASLSYLYGHAPLPGIALESFQVGSTTLDPMLTENAYVQVQRKAYQQHVIGGDFSTTVSDWFGLRGETAFRLPVNYKNVAWAARPDLQWVLGIDREFGPVSVIAQYLGRYTFDWEPARPPDPRGVQGLLALNNNDPADRATAEVGIQNSLFNTNRILFNQLYQLQSLASLRLEWKTLHETLSLSALALYNFNTQEWFVGPKIGYQIGGGFNAYLGAELYGGKKDTLMDLIDEKLTAGYFELRASF